MGGNSASTFQPNQLAQLFGQNGGYQQAAVLGGLGGLFKGK